MSSETIQLTSVPTSPTEPRGVLNYETIQVTPVSSSLGAMIEGADLSQPLSDRQFGEIQQALLEHLVVFFRSQPLTDEQHKDFTGRFGTCHPHPVAAILGETNPVSAVENDKDKPPQKIQDWHTDYSFHRAVPEVAVLRSEIVPPSGGDTLWANMYDAFEALSKPMQSFLEGLSAFHPVTPEFIFEYRRTRGDEAADRIAKEFPGTEHPMVAVHPKTGRKMLFVNPAYVGHVVGLSSKESAALLSFLYAHIDSPSFHVRYRWEADDVAVWDERCTTHQGPSDFHPHHRLLYRVTAGFYAPSR
jgi:taurine dioxygenase